MIPSLDTTLSTFRPEIALGLFTAYVAVDALFAYYTLAITRQQALRAANISFLYYFAIALGVLSYVNNYLYVIPVACGSWLGIYIAVKRQKFSDQLNLPIDHKL